MSPNLITMQNDAELAAFVDLIQREQVLSYLEIGAKFGGSFKRVVEVMPKGSRAVAVDMPGGTRAWSDSKRSLEDVVADLRMSGYDARIIWGDSTDSAVIDRVRDLSPYDAIFIDANHTMPFVQKDWENYSPMGRMIAFHDIAWRRLAECKEGIRIDVPQFWQGIRTDYRYQEFKFCHSGENNGIGVLWR